MSVKLLESGFWHVRLGPNRFAQWQRGTRPSATDFFGWWSEQDKGRAVKEVARHE